MQTLFKTLARPLLLFIVLLLAAAPAQAEERVRLRVTNPFENKTPVAVPAFRATGASDREAALAEEAVALLQKTLAFTGYFRMVSSDAFLEEPSKTGITEQDIHFDRWRSSGAELLVTGSLTVSSQAIIGDFYLYDIFRQKSLFGVRFRGAGTPEETLRPLILKLADKIMVTYSGKHGFFNSRIAFVSTGTTGIKEIWASAFDGHAPVQISRNNAITLTPSWSPDGSTLAYTSYVHEKPDIFIQGSWPGARRDLVTAKGTTNITPTWLPGGKTMAASLTIDGDQAIYLLTQKGKIRKRLTRKWSKWGIDVSPVFSPSGDRMAFVSKRSGSPQIYIKHLATGRIERLTFDGKYNTSPAWSPAGDQIAYAGSRNGHFDVFVINVRGGRPMQLTFDSGDNETPSWSPDGSLIVFSSNRRGRSSIYVMNAYGTDQRQLVSLPGEQTAPVWSPNLTQ
ncbi:Tol-Pal system beta propeller repeat protein TolB [Desulfoluna spongiiphila]|uniref:TolB protein n=1 Tax=Desulfoluna spongiiphila TaxID=419481 RepID=A0A1G5AZA8_9BACT|nr:Tol-Pal system beta propeller repeat protein TolB [Desulfoluna spongiiphila]SCX83174.1 TolB protein [Desulfoluna spongiiphila]VVS92095.1 tol-pal system protein tolb [Desulfoluna spongiiphila]